MKRLLRFLLNSHDRFEGRDDLYSIIVQTLRCRHAIANLPLAIDDVINRADSIAAEAPHFADVSVMIDWLAARLEREEFSLREDVMDGSVEAFA